MNFYKYNLQKATQDEWERSKEVFYEKNATDASLVSQWVAGWSRFKPKCPPPPTISKGARNASSVGDLSCAEGLRID